MRWLSLLVFWCSAACAFGEKWIDGKDLPIEGRAFEDVEEYYDRLAELVWRRMDDVDEWHEIERELIELRRKEKALEERLERYKI